MPDTDHEADAPVSVASDQQALFDDVKRTFANTIVQGQEYAKIMARHLNIPASDLAPIVAKLEEARSLFDSSFRPRKDD